MRETSELFEKLWASPHTVETVADIAGVRYEMSEIFNRRIYGGVYEAPTVGTCASRTLELSVMPKEDIPRGAEIVISARLRSGDEVSEWMKQGVFYISLRPRDKRTGRINITAYDAMRKANTVWLNNSYAEVNWPMKESEAAADIANRMGVELDERTVLDDVFPIGYPVDENGDLTMWSILEGIGVSNGGSWIISEEEKLRLLRYGDIPEETNFLVDERGRVILIGGVAIRV